MVVVDSLMLIVGGMVNLVTGMVVMSAVKKTAVLATYAFYSNSWALEKGTVLISVLHITLFYLCCELEDMNIFLYLQRGNALRLIKKYVHLL